MRVKPFPYEGIAAKKLFIGREKEKKTVLKHIENATNLVLFSKRRMGKSSLLHYCLDNELKDSEYIKIYIDIFSITSAEEFACSLLEGISLHKKIDPRKIQEALKWLGSMFKKVRFEPFIDTTTGSISLKVADTQISFEEMIKEFFSSLQYLSKSKKVVLVIDEFQQIDTIKDKNIAAEFRTHMQLYDDNISYIFLGSKRHRLLDLFKYKAPLYEQATPMEIKSLDNISFFNYATRYLKITQDVVDEIFTIADGETKLIQHICHILHRDYKRREIGIEYVYQALQEILSSKDSMFRLLFDNFSLNQKKAIKILGKYSKKTLSNKVLVEFDIKKESLNSAFKQLFDQEYIDREDGVYFLPDRSFELWCARI